MGSTQGGRPPPDARDPHAYAGGQDFGPYELKLGDRHNFASLLAENLEGAWSDGQSALKYDLQGWYGGLYNRTVLKAEGDATEGRIEDARTEVLYGRALRSYWDGQVGIRLDSGDGPDRTWLAFGMQGLAPYWFELDLAAYVGESGRTALRLDASYELLFTQRLILEPTLEANVYGKDDPARGLGSGLADVDLQLRLRYEIRREIAPYLGVSWVRKFGETGDLAEANGGDASELQFVAGLRFWF
ncbi:MAG: copper resistance protein B [Pseudomonadales bacterium]